MHVYGDGTVAEMLYYFLALSYIFCLFFFFCFFFVMYYIHVYGGVRAIPTYSLPTL